MQEKDPLSAMADNKDIEGLEKAKQDAEAGYDGDTAGRIEKLLAEIQGETAMASVSATVTPEYQITQVTQLGGDTQELNKRLDGINEEAKVIQKTEEEEINSLEKELVGENSPVSFDHIGSHFETDEGSTQDTPFNKGSIVYEVTGKIMRMEPPYATKPGILSVPLQYNIYRGLNGDKVPIFKKTGEEGYDFDNPQVVKRDVFFDPDTKEVYYIDPTLGKKEIKSAKMTKMLEEASVKLDTQKEQDEKIAA